MKRLISALLTIMSFAGCNTRRGSVNMDPVLKQYIRCTDSSCTIAIDTVILDIDDSVAMSKLTGYYKIAWLEPSSIEIGRFEKGMKMGLWITLTESPRFGGTSLLTTAEYENDELNGRLMEFGGDVYPFQDFNYKHNEQVGMQKEFWDNDKPALIYETNENGKFINDYYAFSEEGDTLYHTNFGKNATGHVKQYNRWGKLEREGTMINGEMDTFKEYEYNLADNKYEKIRTYVTTDTFNIVCIKVEPAPINMNLKKQ